MIVARVQRLALMIAAAVLGAASISSAQESTTGTQARIDGARDPSPSVGMRAKIIDVVLPGPELKVKPATDLATPIVLRILDARVHGDGFRYDLEYYGLDPGTFDLAQYLVRADGAATGALPRIAVEIRPLLPPGQVEPNELEPIAPPGLGGYRTTLIVGGVVWVLGLLAIVFWGRRRRRLEAAAEQTPLTFADRLRPIVEDARSGHLDSAGKAELERLLFAYWRDRLGLADRKIGKAMVALRQHDEAGVLLRELEKWLHRPGAHDDVDVGVLLEPYRNAPPGPVVVAESS